MEAASRQLSNIDKKLFVNNTQRYLNKKYIKLLKYKKIRCIIICVRNFVIELKLFMMKKKLQF